MDQTTGTLLGIIALTLALAACGPRMNTPGAPSTRTEPPSAVETAAREALSTRTGVAVEEIETIEAEQMEWPDACLGLAGADEVCAQVITPGWKITLRAEGKEYVLHTDRDATAIRVEEPE